MNQRFIRGIGFSILLISTQWGLAEDRFILRTPPSLLPAVAARHGFAVRSIPNGEGLALVKKSDSRTEDQVIAELAADPDVIRVETDRKAKIPEVRPTSPSGHATIPPPAAPSEHRFLSYFGRLAWASYVNQQAAALIRLADAQQAGATGAGIVAVIDTGIDPAHPVLKGVLVPGYDFVNEQAGSASELSDLDPASARILNQSTAAILDQISVVRVNQSTAAILDQSTAAILDTSRLPPAFAHGTMVAGIIHLVAPTARIMPLKVFQSNGYANLSDIIRAIYYATDTGARVINMSFSLPSASMELMKALNYATAHDVICVASVGNEGAETLVYPAAFQNVIGVAATDNQDRRSSFSNFGPALVKIAAPGDGITTLYPGGNYALVSGTSFAAPFVSGAAALLLDLNSAITQFDAEMRLSKAKKLQTDLGCGRLDLYQALHYAREWD